MYHRRKFLTLTTASLATLATPALATNSYRLGLHRPGTDESVVVEFSADSIGRKTYARINWLMRDVSAGHWKAMDLNLLVIAAEMTNALGIEHLFVQSGYRTPATNKSIRGAAKKSYHMRGQAMDIRAPGISTRILARAASRAGAGGVGRYPSRGFVHVDTGPRRVWTK